MPAIVETCSVCRAEFEVQFRYQMEEREGAFAFYCTQHCLEESVRCAREGSATCDACAKRFRVDLVSQVLYVGRRRRYACSLGCRAQLLREASGMRLGDLGPLSVPPSLPSSPPAAPRPPSEPADRSPLGTSAPADGSAVAGHRPARPAASPTPFPSSPRRIAIFNHKGGTGKTTTAVSVAAGLAARGRRVLLVDTDAQGNVAVSLAARAERSLYHVLVMGLALAEAVQKVRPGLDLLASNETLAAAELYLAGRQNRDRVLSDRLSAATSEYDFVVLDCSPSLSLMNQNALVFADSILCPVACDYLSLVGMRQVIKTVKSVNTLLHHPVQIWGVLPTFFDGRAKICREALETLRAHFGERCLGPVRAAMRVKEAPAQGQTIFEYAAGSTSSDDYLAVVDRLLASRGGEASVRELPGLRRAQAVAP